MAETPDPGLQGLQELDPRVNPDVQAGLPEQQRQAAEARSGEAGVGAENMQGTNEALAKVESGFNGAVGAVALDETTQVRYHRLGGALRELPGAFVDHVRDFKSARRAAAQSRFEKGLDVSTTLQASSGKAKEALISGDQAGHDAQRILMVNNIGDQARRATDSRQYRWAVKLGLAPGYKSMAEGAVRSYDLKINAPAELDTKSAIDAAAAAKAAGNKVEYEQILSDLADKVTFNRDRNHISPQKRSGVVRSVDTALGKVDSPRTEKVDRTEIIASQEKAVAEATQRQAKKDAAEAKQREIRERNERWKDPARVLELRQAMNREVNDRMEKAEPGTSRESVAAAVRKEMLHEYFYQEPVSLKKDSKGPFHPVDIDNPKGSLYGVLAKVNNLLDMPIDELREEAKLPVTKSRYNEPLRVTVGGREGSEVKKDWPNDLRGLDRGYHLGRTTEELDAREKYLDRIAKRQPAVAPPQPTEPQPRSLEDNIRDAAAQMNITPEEAVRRLRGQRTRGEEAITKQQNEFGRQAGILADSDISDTALSALMKWDGTDEGLDEIAKGLSERAVAQHASYKEIMSNKMVSPKSIKLWKLRMSNKADKDKGRERLLEQGDNLLENTVSYDQAAKQFGDDDIRASLREFVAGLDGTGFELSQVVDRAIQDRAQRRPGAPYPPKPKNGNGNGNGTGRRPRPGQVGSAIGAMPAALAEEQARFAEEVARREAEDDDDTEQLAA